jgi:pimeloyl-ACP methyl ester carboxylesterase
MDLPIVFVVDGSAHLRSVGDDLRQAVADAGLPHIVRTFAWSHGPGRVFADLHGHDHQRAKGHDLAAAILSHRASHPDSKVYVVCHSSGAAVVLAAAEHLPDHAVERVIFLAPAVSPACDVKPVLRCARRVDSFHSSGDLIGGLVLALVGNADGSFRSSAGCVGFSPERDGSSSDALYENLRQHAWDWDMNHTGYHGGHFGCTRSAFLRAFIVPLLD